MGLSQISAEEVMAKLWWGTVPRSELPELDLDDELREQVEARCESMGATLVNGFSHWGIRRRRDLDDPFELITRSHRLTYMQMGVMLIAWARLVVPRINGEWDGKEKKEEPSFTSTQLYAACRHLFPKNAKINHEERFSRALGALVNRGYLVRDARGTRKGMEEPLYKMGPAMDIYIDHHALWERLARAGFEALYVQEFESSQPFVAATAERDREADEAPEVESE